VATSVLPSPVFISAILPWCQDHAAEHLHVEVPHAQRALRRFAHHGECLGQQLVERRAPGVPLSSARRLLLQLGVGELRELGLERVDLDDAAPVLLQQPLVTAAEEGAPGRARGTRERCAGQ